MFGSSSMGLLESKLEKDLSSVSFPEGERFFGFENVIKSSFSFVIKPFSFLTQYGNTCYCNSVLQALYFSKPFRKALLEHHKKSKSTLKSLFWQKKSSSLFRLLCRRFDSPLSPWHSLRRNHHSIAQNRNPRPQAIRSGSQTRKCAVPRHSTTRCTRVFELSSKQHFRDFGKEQIT